MRVLGRRHRVFRALRPGGLLAVTEMDFFPRFLPEDVGAGRPGLESRVHAALNTRPPWDWSDHLADAGFVPVATRPFVINLTPPLPSATGQYAHASLSQLRAHLISQLPADDVATLDVLLDNDHPSASSGVQTSPGSCKSVRPVGPAALYAGPARPRAPGGKDYGVAVTMPQG